MPSQYHQFHRPHAKQDGQRVLQQAGQNNGLATAQNFLEINFEADQEK